MPIRTGNPPGRPRKIKTPEEARAYEQRCIERRRELDRRRYHEVIKNDPVKLARLRSRQEAKRAEARAERDAERRAKARARAAQQVREDCLRAVRAVAALVARATVDLTAMRAHLDIGEIRLPEAAE